MSFDFGPEPTFIRRDSKTGQIPSGAKMEVIIRSAIISRSCSRERMISGLAAMFPYSPALHRRDLSIYSMQKVHPDPDALIVFDPPVWLPMTVTVPP